MSDSDTDSSVYNIATPPPDYTRAVQQDIERARRRNKRLPTSPIPLPSMTSRSLSPTRSPRRSSSPQPTPTPIPPTQPTPSPQPTPVSPRDVTAVDQTIAQLAQTVSNSNTNLSFQMSTMAQQISAMANNISANSRAPPVPGPRPPPPNLPPDKPKPPETYDRTKKDMSTFLEEYRNYFALLNTFTPGNPLSDRAKIARVISALDPAQVIWHKSYRERLTAQPSAAGICTADANAYTDLTYDDFCDALTARTEVLTSDESDRIAYKALTLGKMQDPGIFNLEFRRLADKIGTKDEIDLYYDYIERIHPDWNEKLIPVRIDPNGGNALNEAMTNVEKFYTAITGRPIDVSGYRSGHGYASSARGTADRSSHGLGAGTSWSGSANAVGANFGGSQRLGSSEYTGCNVCGDMTHYAKDCPMNGANSSMKGMRKGKGKGQGKGKGKGKGANRYGSRPGKGGAYGRYMGKGWTGQQQKGGWRFIPRSGTRRGYKGTGRAGRGGNKGQPRGRGYLNQASGGASGAEESGNPAETGTSAEAEHGDDLPGGTYNEEEDGEWVYDEEPYEPYYSETGNDDYYYDGWSDEAGGW